MLTCDDYASDLKTSMNYIMYVYMYSLQHSTRVENYAYAIASYRCLFLYQAERELSFADDVGNVGGGVLWYVVAFLVRARALQS